MQAPQFLILENPGEFKSLDSITGDKFEEVERKILPLLEKIIQPFANMNKEKTGYTNTNRPKREVIDEYAYGNITVSVKTTPTTLKTNYKTVVEETENFLNFIKKDYNEGRIRKGILTINKQPYIGLDDVIKKIKELRETALEGKEGIRQKVSVRAPPNIIREGLEKVIYKLGKDYSAGTEENAADFVRAMTLQEAINENFYKKFIKKIEERTGYDDTNPPSKTVQEFIRVGSYLFPVQVIPRESISYAPIINTLIQPYKKRITSKTGELIRLREGLADDVLARYAPKIRENKMFILLETLQERLAEIKTDHTKTKCIYRRDRSIRID